jgi:TM2 domain-containing membrane protein YozV
MSSPVSEASQAPFNPYHIWLGIPQDECPPNHYRLLGIALFETNPDVILNAADQRMAHLRTFQNGPRAKFCQQLLNRVSDAQSCLLNHVARKSYDADLRKTMRRSEPPLRPIAAVPGAMPIGIAPQEHKPPALSLEPHVVDTSGADWFMSTPEGQQFGPVDKGRLDQWEREGRLVAGCFVRRASEIKWSPAVDYYPWLGSRQGGVAEEFVVSSPRSQRRYANNEYHDTNSERVLAGILGIFVGCLGIHKFVLGYAGAGFIMLLVTVLLVFTIVAPLAMTIIGIIEGVIYLTMDDETFYQTYVVGRKEWF